ncbi:DUF3859 domain-containing protein [Rhodobacteraceae bacterium N5(2021)]|uniref:DUF3859 domain-containing protein n=1 Tax=Gymnodinialimonas phycosphaerae TaxID=2841589 RepID=A0A975YFE4_9RHOB|nr:DUF3859 domain-containing protein [Gymnodinialimonas phycosphaerae]MBY4894615.1 DUF3859 domain-containing protein [Gymnodinialimonas phycosphaerae]
MRALSFPVPTRLALCLLTLCLMLLPPPSTAQEANPRVSPLLAELVYGLYCAQEPDRRDPAPGTASGVINMVPMIPDFQFRQKLVPAEIGIGFGVLATAPPDVLHDPVTVTVTHPPYPDSGIEVEQWITDVDDGQNLMGFSFDHAHELVLGEWTFTAHTLAGEELFHIAFEVIAPELMPQVISTCFGSFMS